MVVDRQVGSTSPLVSDTCLLLHNTVCFPWVCCHLQDVSVHGVSPYAWPRKAGLPRMVSVTQNTVSDKELAPKLIDQSGHLDCLDCHVHTKPILIAKGCS